MTDTIIDLFKITESITLQAQKTTNTIVIKGNSVLTIPITDHNHYIIKPARRLRKLVVHLCKIGPWTYYEDYHSALDIADITILYSSKETLYNLEFTDTSLFFILSFDHRDNQVLIPMEIANSCVFNFEPLTDYSNYSSLLPLYQKGYQLVDYSKCNGNILPKEIYLPYFYSQTEVDHLQGMMSQNVGKWEYDVAMVCNATPRRQVIEARLKERGVTVLDVRGWRDDRDLQIAKCRILVNIHPHDENFTLVEHLRINRWFLSGMYVISEESDEQESVDVFNVEFHPYDQIPERVVSFLKKLKERDEVKLSDQETEEAETSDSFAQLRSENIRIYKEKCESQLQILIDKFNL